MTATLPDAASIGGHPGYTADQLRAHGEACAAAEREACAKICDSLEAGTLAAQSGPPDELANVMLRQLALLGYREIATSIRARKDAHES